MNRNHAGLLAIGVLFVAIAIVLVGGVLDRPETSAPEEVSTTAQAPTKAAEKAATAPDKTTAAADAPNAAEKPAAPSEPAKGAEKNSQPSAAEPVKPAVTNETAGTAPSPEPAAPGTPPVAADAGSSGAAGRTAKPVVPTFDVLRVEPDGSTVIAGRAAPGARVQIMNGDKIVTSAAADEQGDFVAVLDEPLAPGDYELKLKAVGKGEQSVESEEVATVSVPSDAKGDLLAMVSKPGEASRIIAAPKGAANATPPMAAETTGEAVDRPGKQPGEDVAMQAPENEPAGTTEQAGRGNRPASAPHVASSGEVRVDAVEIENDNIYVAGAAPAGSKVRVYADDRLVGETEATEEGRFVVDAAMPLAVGDHSIRADLVDPDGQVLVRAAVPFNRPPGDQFTAVAPGAKSAATGTESPAAPPVAAADNGAPSPDVARLRSEAEAALSDLKRKTDASMPSAEEIDQARDKAASSLSALANGPQAAPGAERAQADESVRRRAGSALAMLDALPRFAKGELPDLAAMKAMRSKLPDVAKSLQEDAAQAKGPPVTDVAVETSEPKTVVQPALTGSDDFVIIRRGDTLWQIARRAYGRGVRYTTIYLANSGQISDPDLILPGQVFDVPQKALKNSEELHRERLREERKNAR